MVLGCFVCDIYVIRGTGWLCVHDRSGSYNTAGEVSTE